MGYGDIGIVTPLEKTFTILIMIIGVLSFTFSTASLASIVNNYDNQNAIYKEKLGVLNKIYKQCNISLSLYSRLKNSLMYCYTNDFKDQIDLIEDLPHNLKIELSAILFEKIYNNLKFLNGQSTSFTAWICPLLKP